MRKLFQYGGIAEVAFDKGRAFSIPGAQYKAIVAATRLVRTPFMVATTTGKNEARKMRKIGARLLTPNQITASGIPATVGTADDVKDSNLIVCATTALTAAPVSSRMMKQRS